MFDLLINAEVIVDDVSVAERVFVDALGFPEPRPSWSGKEPGFGFISNDPAAPLKNSLSPSGRKTCA